jgi:hypothetical protein
VLHCLRNCLHHGINHDTDRFCVARRQMCTMCHDLTLSSPGATGFSRPSRAPALKSEHVIKPLLAQEMTQSKLSKQLGRVYQETGQLFYTLAPLVAVSPPDMSLLNRPRCSISLFEVEMENAVLLPKAGWLIRSRNITWSYRALSRHHGILFR